MKSETANTPALKMAFLTYIFLGITDTIHHIHAAWRLEQQNAIHAAIAGMLLVPIAITSVWLFKHKGSSLFIRIFLVIAIAAILIPGFYHGGWNHLIKVLAHIRLETPNTDIQSLFPMNNLDLWFYEITGIMEFVFATVCLSSILKLSPYR